MSSTEVISIDEKENRYKYVLDLLGSTFSKEVKVVPATVQHLGEMEEQFCTKALLGILNSFFGYREVIIGLGPGRCGTMSLAALLASQPYVMAHHESIPRLPWFGSVFQFIGKWAQLFYTVNPALPIIADVASSYLPYVPLIMIVCPNTKFICLERDVEDIVKSFVIKSYATSHWTDAHSEHWKQEWHRFHPYRHCFPSYDLPREEGCRRYVTEYYKQAYVWKESFPDNFEIFNINDLNSEESFYNILDFCNINKEERKYIPIWINKLGNVHYEYAERWDKAAKEI